LVQETGWRFLRERGIDLIASDSPGAFLDETPTAIMIRQLLGVISEFEKASLVAKLRGARERKKRATGKCEGRRSVSEMNPAAVMMARSLHAERRGERPTTLREIADKLAQADHRASTGKPYAPSVVARMLRRAS
jgi:DNA invertase Pin-like site-specific DNA recombinase